MVISFQKKVGLLNRQTVILIKSRKIDKLTTKVKVCKKQAQLAYLFLHKGINRERRRTERDTFLKGSVGVPPELRMNTMLDQRCLRLKIANVVSKPLLGLLMGKGGMLSKLKQVNLQISRFSSMSHLVQSRVNSRQKKKLYSK